MRKLYPYQSKAAWHLYRHTKQALFAGLGSGKTAVLLHVLEKMLSEFTITKVLVVAPIAVCKAVWVQEAQEWPRTRWLRFSRVLGTAKQRGKALAQEAEIYLINYESLSWLLNLPDIDSFDALVLDESTMIQSSSSVRFAGKGRRMNPKTREWIPPVKGLKKVVGNFQCVYLISGTPKPGEYLGLWSQMFCLDQGKTLGQNITGFKREYYYQYGPEFYQLSLKKGKDKEIQRKLKHLCYRIPSKDVAAVLPKVTELTHYVDMPQKAWKVYRELEDDFFAQIEGQAITVDIIAVLSNKLQQVCQGAVYDDEHNVRSIHNEKIDMLDALLNDLPGRNALVVYTYRHDIDRLLKYKKYPVLRAGMPENKFNEIVDNWNNKKYPVIYGHPASMGHGLNLQGGGFDIIFFGLTWSLDKYQQTIGRLRRSGQPGKVVFVHRIVTRNTVEDKLMLPRLKKRSESQKDFLASFNQYRSKK